MKRQIVWIAAAIGIAGLVRDSAASGLSAKRRVADLLQRVVGAPAQVQPAPPALDPGSRAPDWFRDPPSAARPIAGFFGERTIKGRLSATEERARADARQALDRTVSEWLAPEVPRTWKVPKPMVDALIRQSHVEPVAHDLGAPDLKDFRVVYLGGYLVDFSADRHSQIVEVYTRELVAKRMAFLGGGLGLALIALTGLAGYIRADEATRGYYTNHLRLVTAAGVGAASVALYRWLA